MSGVGYDIDEVMHVIYSLVSGSFLVLNECINESRRINLSHRISSAAQTTVFGIQTTVFLDKLMLKAIPSAAQMIVVWIADGIAFSISYFKSPFSRM